MPAILMVLVTLWERAMPAILLMFVVVLCPSASRASYPLSKLARAVRHTPFQNSLEPSMGARRQRRRERWYGLPAGQEVPERSRRAFPTVYGFERGYDTRLFPTNTGIPFFQKHHQ